MVARCPSTMGSRELGMRLHLSVHFMSPFFLFSILLARDLLTTQFSNWLWVLDIRKLSLCWWPYPIVHADPGRKRREGVCGA